jgi:glycosyltransferase involved in cell wall biosynthesis
MSVEASVIVPARNAESFIAAALRSITVTTAFSIEVIVVDDGSSDHTREVAESFRDERIKVISGPQKGISAALNAALAVATGRLIMRCDADDLYPPGRIERQITWLGENPSCGAVCGRFLMLDAQGGVVATPLIGDQLADCINEELFAGVTRTHLCTYAIRRDAVIALKGFREYFESAEDIDFALRLSHLCKVAYLPETFYLYRIHDQSITHAMGSERRQFFDSTAKLFQSQRCLNGSDALDLGDPPVPPPSSPESRYGANQHLFDLIVGQTWADMSATRSRHALAGAWRLICLRPTSLAAWMTLGKVLGLTVLRRPPAQ